MQCFSASSNDSLEERLRDCFHFGSTRASRRHLVRLEPGLKGILLDFESASCSTNQRNLYEAYDWDSILYYLWHVHDSAILLRSAKISPLPILHSQKGS